MGGVQRLRDGANQLQPLKKIEMLTMGADEVVQTLRGPVVLERERRTVLAVDELTRAQDSWVADALQELELTPRSIGQQSTLRSAE